MKKDVAVLFIGCSGMMVDERIIIYICIIDFTLAE